MGKKIICRLAPRGRKSKDQGGGKEIKGRATIYSPAYMSSLTF